MNDAAVRVTWARSTSRVTGRLLCFLFVADERGRVSFRTLIGQSRWQRLAGLGTLRSHPAREMLLRQGDPGEFLLILLSGRVRVFARDVDGAELLVALRGSGDVVGEMAIQRSAMRSANVETLDRCSVRLVSRSVFREFLATNRLDVAFSDYLVEKLAETVPYQLRLAHFSPRRRLATLLLDLVALVEPGRQDRLRIPLTQEGLASALGLSRSTVAAHLAAFRSAGALTPGRALVVADPMKLARYVTSTA